MTTDSHYLPLLFDNVSVKRVEGVEKSNEDLFLATPNLSPTQKTITLNASYRTMNGQTVLNGTEITIDPFETLILFPL